LDSKQIPFNKPHLVGTEKDYISQALAFGQFSGQGPFAKKCSTWLEQLTGARVFLTNSCTSALEMAAILLNIKPGDEVIMPSYTFTSTANAFVLRGAIPVFVDIRPDTLNIDEALIEASITKKTKAIVIVHYAGVACEMDSIMEIAARYHLFVVEDAAQGLLSSYKGRPLGTIGHLGCYSFHETKNITSGGEGGALIINRSDWFERAQILIDKGTNRHQFFNGLVDKYTWVGLGSSYGMNELLAAFLWAQLEGSKDIMLRRMRLWEQYDFGLKALEEASLLRRPVIPPERQHNAHIYYILLPSLEKRERLLEELKLVGIGATFHYVPLHSTPYGKKVARYDGNLPVTDEQSSRLLRLPLWVGLEDQQKFVLNALKNCFLS